MIESDVVASCNAGLYFMLRPRAARIRMRKAVRTKAKNKVSLAGSKADPKKVAAFGLVDFASSRIVVPIKGQDQVVGRHLTINILKTNNS